MQSFFMNGYHTRKKSFYEDNYNIFTTHVLKTEPVLTQLILKVS